MLHLLKPRPYKTPYSMHLENIRLCKPSHLQREIPRSWEQSGSFLPPSLHPRFPPPFSPPQNKLAFCSVVTELSENCIGPYDLVISGIVLICLPVVRLYSL